MVVYLAFIFIIVAFIYGQIFRHPTAGPIGIRKGFLVSLVQMVVVAVLLVAVMLAFAAYKHFST
jgi:hypothetical protein